MDLEQTSPVPQKQQAKVNTLTFFDALREAMEAKRITRIEWNNKEIYGCLLDDQLQIRLADDKFHPWIISKGDLDAIDWIVV